MAQYTDYINKASSSTSTLASTLKSTATSMGIMLAVDLAIQAVTTAWDEMNVTVSEIQGNIDGITARLDSLKAEYDMLHSLDPDSLSQAEKDRLQYLDDRIRKEERLLQIEQARKDEEAYGGGFTDFFDKDNYRRQFFDSQAGPNILSNIIDWAGGGASDSYSGLAMNAKNSLTSYSEKTAAIERLKTLQEGLNESSQEYLMLQHQIDGHQTTLDSIMPGMEDQLMAFEKILAADQAVLEDAERVISSPDSTHNARQNAIEVKELYESRIQDAQAFAGRLEKILHTPQAALQSLDERLDNLSAAELEDHFSEDEIQILYHTTLDREATLQDLKNLVAELQKEATIQAGKISFDEAFNALPADIRESLTDLARSGGITPSVLRSTEDYKALLSETGLSAEEAAGRILNLLDAADKLSAAGNGLRNLQSAYGEFQEKGFVLAETLSGLPDVFQELEGYQAFETVVGDPSSSTGQVQNAFNNIAAEYLASQQTLAGVTQDNMQAYIANLKEMGIMNAEEFINHYLQIANESAQLVNATSQDAYNAYIKYLESKDLADLAYFNNLISNNSELLKSLGSTYQSDFNNWGELLQKKAVAYNNFVTSIKGSQINLGSGSAALSDQGAAEAQARAILQNAARNGTKSVSSNLLVKTPMDFITGRGTTNKNPNAKYTQDQVDQARAYLDSIKELNQLKSQLAIDLSTVNTDFGGSLSFSGSSGSPKSGSAPAEPPARDTTKTYNWIEKALTRLREAYDRIHKTAASVYRTFTSRNTALSQELDSITGQINAQQAAYDEYMRRAGSVGLSDHYKNLVQNGSISIEDITDETLQKQIEEYQEYYEAAVKAGDALKDLKETYSNLAKEKFDLAAGESDSRLSLIQKEAGLAETHISNAQIRGNLVSTRYYEILSENEKRAMDQLTAGRSALKQAFQEAVDSGSVEAGSRAYREMQAEILDVENELLKSSGALEEFSNKIRQLEWERFDMLQDTISQITGEADWLIGRLEEDSLYDGNGNLSRKGMAAAGLHGVKHNTYLNQALEYGQEIEALENALSKDPYDTKLLERRYELAEAQRKVIAAAEDEKEAMRDLVKGGIEIQLDALQELIDKRKDALRTEKDLYSYQKQVKEQTETISQLEKQMQAYQGDTSQETRAQLQQLEVKLAAAKEDLTETEYDKYLSDQEALMDEMYIRYEEIMNQRLDNLDALVEDLIGQVNASAAEIGETISGKAEELGVDLSDSMERIWNGDNGIRDVLSASADRLSDTFTTTGAAIADIKKLLEEMQKDSDEKAESDAAAMEEASEAPTPSAPTGEKKETPPAPADEGSGSRPWGSWFRNKKDSYPKNRLNTETSIVDRLKYRDLDASFPARADYYYAMGGTGTYTGSAGQNLWMIAQMRANGYRKGSRSIPRSQYAWTHEGGQEMIYRKSDGALLTRLDVGDKVFNSHMAENLWQISHGEFMERLNRQLEFPTANCPSTNVTNYFTMDNVTLPNVTNYEEFKHELIRDRQFNAAMKDATLGEALGYNSLRKYSR